MKKSILFFSIVLLFTFSCKSVSKNSFELDRAILVLNQTVPFYPKGSNSISPMSYVDENYGAQFFKTGVKEVIINRVNASIRKPQIIKYKQIKNDGTLAKADKDSILKIIERAIKIKVTDFLSDEDLIHMSKTVSKQINWRKTGLRSDIPISKSKEVSKLSIPVFSVDGNYAAYFFGGNSAMSIRFCKKTIEGKWVFYSSGTLWIE